MEEKLTPTNEAGGSADVLRATSVVTVSQEQISCDLGGEAAILHLASGIYFGLDAVGASVWQLIQQPKTVGEIQAALLQEYDVEAARCEADLQALLRDLAAASGRGVRRLLRFNGDFGGAVLGF